MSAAKSKASKNFETKSKYPDDSQQTRWITRTRQGDKTAFDNIVAKYEQSVYNLCYRKLGNVDEAEDAAQEVFLRAYARLESYDDRWQFSTWLFSIASNYCIDRLRRPQPALVSWDLLKDSWPAVGRTQPEQALLSAETTAEVQALLKSLSRDDRLVVMLRYWYTLSYQDMAETLGTTVSAIKSKLFRARKALARTATSQRQKAALTPKRMTPVMGY